MFPNSGFQETDINKVWSDWTKWQMTMYFKDGVGVIKEQLTITDRSEYFLFRPVRWSTIGDVTLVEKEPMQSSPFNNNFKAILQRVFSKKEDTVVSKGN